MTLWMIQKMIGMQLDSLCGASIHPWMTVDDNTMNVALWMGPCGSVRSVVSLDGKPDLHPGGFTERPGRESQAQAGIGGLGE